MTFSKSKHFDTRLGYHTTFQKLGYGQVRRRKEDEWVLRSEDVGGEFRRKKIGEVLSKKQVMMQENLKSSRADL